MRLASPLAMFRSSVPPHSANDASWQSSSYAEGHDEGMSRAMGAVLGGLPGTERQYQVAKMLATLPMRLGGLVLRSAQ